MRELSMKNSLIVLTLLIAGLSVVSAAAEAENDIPEYTVEGLKLVPNTKRVALVWAEPGANLAQYERVFLVEPYVAFKKNWQRDQNRSSSTRITTADMDRIKSSVKNLFMDVFTEELENGGYTLATERAEDVLIVKPAVIDLDVSAPDTRSAGRSTSFTTTAGSMTLYMELFDAETDDLLAKVLDPQRDRDTGMMQWQTSVANRAAARRIMQKWAEALRKGLDEAREETGE